MLRISELSHRRGNGTRMINQEQNMLECADLQQITLDDGTKLTQKQSIAVYLHVTTDLTLKEIAELAGYKDHAGVSVALRSKNGVAARELVQTEQMFRAGEIGLVVCLELARGARSEKVRLDAAVQLMDRAAAARPSVSGGARASGVNIQINVDQGNKVSAHEALAGEVVPDSVSVPEGLRS